MRWDNELVERERERERLPKKRERERERERERDETFDFVYTPIHQSLSRTISYFGKDKEEDIDIYTTHALMHTHTKTHGNKSNARWLQILQSGWHSHLPFRAKVFI